MQLQLHLDRRKTNRDAEIKRLVDDLDVNRCATRILCDIYSDLKYEQCIITPHVLKITYVSDFFAVWGVEMVTFMTLITSLYSKIEIE
jgi:hypothetical protein